MRGGFSFFTPPTCFETMARKSARASGDQTTAIRSGAVCSLFYLRPNPRRISSYGMPSPRAGTINRRGGFGRDLFVLKGRQGQRARQRLDHHFEQAAYGGKFFGGQDIEQRECLLALLCEIGL